MAAAAAARFVPDSVRLIETMLPRVRVALPPDGHRRPRAPLRRAGDAVWLELGFGGGEHLAAQAAAHPEIGMLGAEVFENGVAKLLGEIERAGLANIRIFLDDAPAAARGPARPQHRRARSSSFPIPGPRSGTKSAASSRRRRSMRWRA